MTQPPVDAPVQRSNDGEGAPGRQDGQRMTRAAGVRRAAAIAAAGVPVGLLWWVLAPSGLNVLTGDPALRDGSNLDTWLPRDLVLAGLFLLAGCIAGALASGTKHQEPSSRDVVLAVAAGAAGAFLAWGTGVLCGLWWGPAEDASANSSVAFSLRSYAVLARRRRAGHLRRQVLRGPAEAGACGTRGVTATGGRGPARKMDG